MTRFQNGYASEFDFQPWQGPIRIDYMIATTPRSGSTLLSHELWHTGVLGAPLEYLNFSPDSHYLDVDDPAAQLAHWDRVRATRTSPNGVFGHKVFPHFLAEMKRGNPALLRRIRPQRIIHLVREDRLAQAISYARAHQTGVWTAGADASATEVYSREAIEQATVWIARQDDAWARLFGDLGVEPFRVTYEALADDPGQTVKNIARFLGVELSGSRLSGMPMPIRQADRHTTRWRSRYISSTASR